MVDVKDFAGFGQAVTKLLEVCANGLGSLWLPRQTRRLAAARAAETRQLAAARADEMRLLAVAESDVEAIKLIKRIDIEKLRMTGERELEEYRQRLLQPSAKEPSNEEIEVIFEEPDQSLQLAANAHDRAEYQEVKRQLNLQCVVGEAYNNLEDNVSSEPVDDDWIARFFSAAQDISNENMQQIWGKILAGEVRKPGSFSLRTLERLRNLSREEAEMLTAVAGCFEERTGVLLFGSEADRLLPPRISILVEAGLLHERSMWQYSGSKTLVLEYMSGKISVTRRGPGLMDRFDSTRSTAELMSVVARKPQPEYLEALKKDLRRAGYVVQDEPSGADSADAEQSPAADQCPDPDVGHE